jgi:EAL domain-containing protein (putative c-di-GMP-specific phosphodiesterase class I)
MSQPAQPAELTQAAQAAAAPSSAPALSHPVSYPVLQHYLARLSGAGGATSSIRLDADGKAQGRFFNCTMGSAFQPIRQLDAADRAALAYEGLARGVALADQGLSLWKLLDHAASDDESIELDRLCRMLHAINFFRQLQAPAAGQEPVDLYLNVHDRLLGAVSSNHGHAFQRILAALGLPIERIVLQLPQVTPQQGWLLQYVADNYRRNGFRFAVNAATPAEALDLLARVRPDVLKLDARLLGQADQPDLLRLAQASHAQGARLVFKRLETSTALALLRWLAVAAGVPVLAQGYLLDTPDAVLAGGGRQLAAA